MINFALSALPLVLTSLVTLASAQDGCSQTGCSGPFGAGSCDVVRPRLFTRDKNGNKRLAYTELRRCRKCPAGWTGLRCQRPCQNFYKQCTTTWAEQNRCRRFSHITAYFMDNCPLNCGVCDPGEWKLETPIPILAEPLAWFLGRWEADSATGDRFPINMPGAYHETLTIRQEKITMFDRPSLNISQVAVPVGGGRSLVDVGFMTSRFGNEDSGYIKNQHSVAEHLRDIGMSWNGNQGLNWVEQGTMDGESISLDVKWAFSALGAESARWKGRRTFTKTGPESLIEDVVLEDGRRFRKAYRRTEDFLRPVRKTRADWEDPDF